jgi:hypothetical protein
MRLAPSLNAVDGAAGPRRVSRPLAWTCALHGATARQTKAPQRPERYEADEIDFAVRNISGNTQLSAGMRRAWPSRTASRSEMYDRYQRVLNVSVEFFETLAT